MRPIEIPPAMIERAARALYGTYCAESATDDPPSWEEQTDEEYRQQFRREVRIVLEAALTPQPIGGETPFFQTLYFQADGQWVSGPMRYRYETSRERAGLEPLGLTHALVLPVWEGE